MATNFKYALQTDLEMYYPNFSSYDTKRQILGWTLGKTNWYDSSLDIYFSHNTGLISKLFYDGAVIDRIPYNTTETTKLDGALAADGVVFYVDASHGLGANDIVKIDNEYIRVVSVSDDTITVSSPADNRGLFDTNTQHHANDTSVYLIIDASVDVGDASSNTADALSDVYDTDLDLSILITTINPNDHLMEGGIDNATYFDQMLVNASMELNNLLDGRYATPLPKVPQIDQDTASISQAKEYDAIVIKMTCYICVSNILRAEGQTEEADYYYSQVTNAERTGMVDRLNAGEFKLSYEVDAKDSQGKINRIAGSGSMDLVEVAGEYVGEKYDLLRITCTTAGVYGVAKVKVEYYGNDKIFGQESNPEIVTGGLQSLSGMGGLLVRFQGSAMSIATADTWEIEVNSADRKITNAQSSAIELNRTGYTY
jgi:phage gp36-like protein